MPVPQKINFLASQAGKPVQKRFIDNGARCEFEGLAESLLISLLRAGSRARPTRKFSFCGTGILLVLENIVRLD
ncbi:hypothetical protein [Microcoleus sp. N3A4]|uniref:hypothetical protein n=1 Tax=Microcoleus sp. N3A4 TaxID=3055379 RepID=UPI002FCFE453